VPPRELSYILGNPPFGGAKYMNDEQRADMAAVFSNVSSAGLLDFVSAWYRKAADYMAENPPSRPPLFPPTPSPRASKLASCGLTF